MSREGSITQCLYAHPLCLRVCALIDVAADWDRWHAGAWAIWPHHWKHHPSKTDGLWHHHGKHFHALLTGRSVMQAPRLSSHYWRHHPGEAPGPSSRDICMLFARTSPRLSGHAFRGADLSIDSRGISMMQVPGPWKHASEAPPGEAPGPWQVDLKSLTGRMGCRRRPHGPIIRCTTREKYPAQAAALCGDIALAQQACILGC